MKLNLKYMHVNQKFMKFLETILLIRHMMVPELMYPQQTLEQEHPSPENQVYF